MRKTTFVAQHEGLCAALSFVYINSVTLGVIMFVQYLKHNCKSRPLQYILLILSIIFMLVISVVANGIMLDNISDNYAKLEARSCSFILSDGVGISEIRDDINNFLANSPVEIKEMSLYGDSDLYVKYFPDYEGVKAWEDEFGALDNNFTEEQYLSHEKVAIVGTESGGGMYGVPPHTYTDDDHILLEGEEYRIIGRSSSSFYAFVLWGAEPPNTNLRLFDIYFKDYPSKEQIKEINQLVQDKLIKDRNTKYEAELVSADDLLATRKSVSNIVITAFVQIIAAFNALLLFKYMLDMRKKYFAVLRLCGFGKSVCVKYSFGELFIVSGLSAVVACVIIGYLRPVLAYYFDIFRVMFDAWHMAIYAMSFLAAVALVFAVYVIPSLGKSVTRELREM